MPTRAERLQHLNRELKRMLEQITSRQGEIQGTAQQFRTLRIELKSTRDWLQTHSTQTQVLSSDPDLNECRANLKALREAGGIPGLSHTVAGRKAPSRTCPPPRRSGFGVGRNQQTNLVGQFILVPIKRQRLTHILCTARSQAAGISATLTLPCEISLTTRAYARATFKILRRMRACNSGRSRG